MVLSRVACDGMVLDWNVCRELYDMVRMQLVIVDQTKKGNDV